MTHVDCRKVGGSIGDLKVEGFRCVFTEGSIGVRRCKEAGYLTGIESYTVTRYCSVQQLALGESNWLDDRSQVDRFNSC